MQDGNLNHSPQVRLRSPPEDHRGSRERRWHPNPPFPPGIREERLNVGKKVGILFAGVVAVLQIAVAGILVYNRVQMSRMRRSGEAVLAEPRSSCEVA
ncbi:hypothetical protein QJS10_CPA09g00126 [Acorus calamus]|uniref:Uncharacterized protein n=1 Tax=Acorus calamus TaxID=4465 RepID=A0AAV9E3I1_ACOCL|nr:hypothetical protein QJS10_CPA09g00126 [Acorus calamus]